MKLKELLWATGVDKTTIRTGDGTITDISDLTEFTTRKREELTAVREVGFRTFRLAVSANQVMTSPDTFDFTETDKQIDLLRSLGFNRIIIDALHHNNFYHLEDGVLNPKFEQLFLRWIRALLKRYPWVDAINIVNEPFTNALFMGLTGVWYPHLEDDKPFLKMALVLARVICKASRWIKHNHPNVKIVHIDTCEYHQGCDKPSKQHARFLNERRFMVLDLMLGYMDETNPFFWYMKKYGMTRAHVKWFKRNTATLDILGLNYYARHESLWSIEGWMWPNPISPYGFAEIAKQYWKRYKKHFTSMELTEYNIRGLITDRLTCVRWILEECHKVRRSGIPLTTIHLYPYADTIGWTNLCTENDGIIDPHGMVFWRDKNLDIQVSELSESIRDVIHGRIKWHEIRTYRFQHPVLDQKFAYANKFMQDYNWIDIDSSYLPEEHNNRDHTEDIRQHRLLSSIGVLHNFFNIKR